MIRLHLLSLLLAFSFALTAPYFATASFKLKPSATPISTYLKNAKLIDIINLSPDDLAAFKGKRMNIWDRISFKIMKMNMRKELKENPDILVSDYYSKTMQKRLAWGWWVLISVGALLILFAILSALALASLNGNG